MLIQIKHSIKQFCRVRCNLRIFTSFLSNPILLTIANKPSEIHRQVPNTLYMYNNIGDEITTWPYNVIFVYKNIDNFYNLEESKFIKFLNDNQGLFSRELLIVVLISKLLRPNLHSVPSRNNFSFRKQYTLEYFNRN